MAMFDGWFGPDEPQAGPALAVAWPRVSPPAAVDCLACRLDATNRVAVAAAVAVGTVEWNAVV